MPAAGAHDLGPEASGSRPRHEYPAISARGFGTSLLRSVREAYFARLNQAWRAHCVAYPLLERIRLRLVHSPYWTLIPALMGYIDDLDGHQPGATITVVLPELVPAHWWEQPLPTQTALWLEAALLFRPGTVVISVPNHLEKQASDRS